MNVKYGLTVNVNNNRSVLTAVNSVAKHNKGIKIIVVNYTDGFVSANIPGVYCHNIVGNKGHGPGIVEGMCLIATKDPSADVLVFDNDINMKSGGFIEACSEAVGDKEFYGIGDVYNDASIEKSTNADKGEFRYMAPYCCVLSCRTFFNYRLPTDHPVPMVAPMYDMYKKGRYDMIHDVDPKSWVTHAWSATSNKYQTRSYSTKLKCFQLLGDSVPGSFWNEETF